MFGAKCFKCCRTIAHSDWVRRAREQVMMMMMMRRRRMLRMMVMRWKKIVSMMELMVMMVTILITRFTTWLASLVIAVSDN